MNDFTKEELKELDYVLKNLDYQKSMIFIKKLDKKIQSLIDNYCEHEPEPTPQEFCCIKCQRTLL